MRDNQKPYCHPLIGEILAKQWFGSKGAEGSKFSDKFNPVPLALVALITTGVGFSSNMLCQTLWLHLRLKQLCKIGKMEDTLVQISHLKSIQPIGTSTSLVSINSRRGQITGLQICRRNYSTLHSDYFLVLVLTYRYLTPCQQAVHE